MFTRTILAAAAIASIFIAPCAAANLEPPAVIPLKQTSDVLQADVTAAALEYERRITSALEVSNVGDEALDPKVLQTLNAAAAWFARAPDAPPEERVWQLAAGLVQNAKCEDPMIGAIYIHILERRGRRSASTLRLAVPIAESLSQSAYPAHRRAMFLFTLGDLHANSDARDEASAAYAAGAAMMVEALAEENLSPLHERYLLRLVRQRLEAKPRMSGQHLIDAISSDQQVSPWVRETALGEWHVKLAWDARGSGWAHAVKPEGWEGFRQHLAVARRHLTEAFAIDPSRPEAPTRMITIAMAGHAAPGETIFTWFDRAVAAQFDYEPAYNALLWALRPRWRGSHETMIEFGRLCAATERYDTIVPFQFVRAVQGISADLADPDDAWRLPGIIEELAPVLENTAAHPAHTADRRRYYAMLAGIAWHAGAHDIGRRAVRSAGGTAQLSEYFALVNAPMERAVAENAILSSSVAEDYRKVQTAAAAGRWSEALSLLEALDASRDGEAMMARTYLLAMYRTMDGFHRGQWTPCVPEDGQYGGWTRLLGTWFGNRADQYARGRPTSDGLLTLMDAPVGSRYELRSTIDLSGIREGWSGNAGFILDYRREGRTDRFASVRILAASNRVSVANRLSPGKYAPLPPPLDAAHPRRHHLYISVWDQGLVVRINGETVFADEVPHIRADASNGRIGLGGYFRWSGIGDIYFRDLQVRRLTERPAELPPPRQIDWEELLDLIPPDEGDDLGGIALAPSSPITLATAATTP